MTGIRKSSKSRHMPNFRRRLQRALSLSSSESEYSQTPTASLSGDTTEQDSTHSADNMEAASPKDDLPDTIENGTQLIPRLRAYGAQSGLSKDSNMLALQCVADLESRVRSLENLMMDQSKSIEDTRGQLADLCHRWEDLETEADERPKRDLTLSLDEPGQKVLQSRRSHRSGKSSGWDKNP